MRENLNALRRQPTNRVKLLQLPPKHVTRDMGRGGLTTSQKNFLSHALQNVLMDDNGYVPVVAMPAAC